MSSKVLIALTSYHGEFKPSGAKTGVYTVEALHPFNTFRANNVDVDFVSETGTFGWDEESTSGDVLGDDLKAFNDKSTEFNTKIGQIKKAADVNPADYAAVYFAGGHGTIFDFPKADNLHNIAAEIYDKGGVVAAVCHGPAIFDGLIEKATGKPLAQGKVITGFVDAAETLLGLDGALKKYNVEAPNQVAKKVGAKFLEPVGMWDDYTIADGRVLTGTNPASASSLAKRVITLINKN